MITGSIVALVTPMNTAGDVDWAALERLIELHIESGTAALGAVGTTGESPTLTIPEHCEVIRFCVQQAAGRIPVVAGTGSNSTREAIELTLSAAAAGADACLSVTPYYNKPSQPGLIAHYKALAAAADVPLILYNVPGRTSVDISNDTAELLADVKNIVGIKDATGDVERGRDLIRRLDGRMAVYSGDDATAMALMLSGAMGNISVTANVAPAAMAELCRLAIAGDAQGAARIDARLAPVNSALFVQSNPIPVKWALQKQGLIEAGIRLPLLPLDERYHAEMSAALEAAGL